MKQLYSKPGSPLEIHCNEFEPIIQSIGIDHTCPALEQDQLDEEEKWDDSYTREKAHPFSKSIEQDSLGYREGDRDPYDTR